MPSLAAYEAERADRLRGELGLLRDKQERERSVLELLAYLAAHSQSVTLTSDPAERDANDWECSVVTGGKRYTHISETIEAAVRGCNLQIMEATTEPR